MKPLLTTFSPPAPKPESSEPSGRSFATAIAPVPAGLSVLPTTTAPPSAVTATLAPAPPNSVPPKSMVVLPSPLKEVSTSPGAARATPVERTSPTIRAPKTESRARPMVITVSPPGRRDSKIAEKFPPPYRHPRFAGV